MQQHDGMCFPTLADAVEGLQLLLAQRLYALGVALATGVDTSHLTLVSL